MTLEVRFLITCSSSVPHDQPHKPSCVYSLQYIAAWEPRVQLIAKKRLTFPKNKTDSPVKVAELGQVKCKKVKPYKKIHKTWKAKEVMKALQKKTKQTNKHEKLYRILKTVSFNDHHISINSNLQKPFSTWLLCIQRDVFTSRGVGQINRPDPDSRWVIWTGSRWNCRQMLSGCDQLPFSSEANKQSFLYLLKVLNKSLIFMALLLKRKASERFYFSTGKHKECAYLAEIKW